MLERIRNDNLIKITCLIFLFFTSWWVILQFPTPFHQNLNKFFGGLYGMMALFGAYWGYSISKSWGGVRSLMGKTILMFSVGLLAQEFGQLVYFYYIFFHNIQAPYPSIGDLGYFGSIPLYIAGVLFLAKASGVKVSLQSLRHKLLAIIIPLAILFASYVIFLNGYKIDVSHPLTTILDFGYPLGEAIYISLALLTYLLSRKILGGVMKKRILFILFALFVQYLSDFTFLYQAQKETWVAGGANDFLYLTAYFIMTVALLELRIENVRNRLK